MDEDERNELVRAAYEMMVARDAACDLVARACDRALHDYLPLTKHKAQEYMDEMEKLRKVGKK